jgi:hypothetical protein
MNIFKKVKNKKIVNKPSKAEIRKNIREMWFNLLVEFSSIDVQKFLWFGNEKGLISDHGELICGYFDDFLNSDYYDKVIKEGFVTEEEYKIIEPFHQALLDYKEPSDSEEDIINDKNWIDITHLANECFSKLKSGLTDKSELEFILGVEDRFELV